jgi:hypothetical protein
MPASWKVENGSLLSRRQKGESAGDIVTVNAYDDFELALQWKMTPGGNSGVVYRASEDRDNVWESGPEYQILDNSGHLDGLNPLASAGACYAVFAHVKTSKFYLTAYGQGNWGRALKGHIALQDYGGAIEFRSIKLRPLSCR